MVLRNVAAAVKDAKFFCIMADETMDKSNREQVVICIRWVDNNLEAHEEFMGLYQVDSIDAKTITAVILDTLLRMDLPISKCRGQCYDGCSKMTGARTGVATNIKSQEPRCLFTHCYGHALNLACSDSVKGCKRMKNALDTTHEITKLIKLSPKRDTKLENLRKNAYVTLPSASKSGIRLLCPTRWTVRADAMSSIMENYAVLFELWNWSTDNVSDTEMTARIRGMEAFMHKFDFFYGLHLGHKLLRYADNLSTQLQKPALSAAEGQKLAAMTTDALNSLRTDSEFDAFWAEITTEAAKLEVHEPS